MARTLYPYWLFTGADDAEGGVDDLEATFPNLDDALYATTQVEAHRRQEGVWYQLVDITTAYVVKARSFLFTAGWYDYRAEEDAET